MSRGVESLRIPKKKNIKKFTADGSAKKKIIGKQDKYEKKNMNEFFGSIGRRKKKKRDGRIFFCVGALIFKEKKIVF